MRVIRGAMIKCTSVTLSLAITWSPGRRRHPKGWHSETPRMLWCYRDIDRGGKKITEEGQKGEVETPHQSESYLD